MNILHTSDWHLGRTLYGRKRYDEFEAFLAWLVETIHQRAVDVLLIAGDVFDTSLPSNRAQELYYQFLCQVAASSCRHVVVIAGNHDSPSFLNAPKSLLRVLDVHVVGAVTDHLEDEVLLLNDEDGRPELIVCAVPYLRDRDIRVAEAGESIEDKERKLIDGIREHYVQVCALAETKRKQLDVHIPMIAMGHLFTAGGKTMDGDGVRELYVGTLAHVSARVFPDCIDYLALGHLHVAQQVNGLEHLRYSGSPLAMGFGEAKQEKSVCLVDLVPDAPVVELINVPVFQTLELIQGDWEAISARILEVLAAQRSVWLEIIYDGDDVIDDLHQRLEAMVANSGVEILRVKNNRIIDRVLNQTRDDETLDDLNINDVFERCLVAHHIPDEQRPVLLHAYHETVMSLYQRDDRAE